MSDYVAAINATTRGYANAFKRQAILNPEVAQELVFDGGLRGEVTPTFVKNWANSSWAKEPIFDSKGRLTEFGQKGIRRAIQDLGLPENASLDEIMSASAKMKKKQAARLSAKLSNRLPEVQKAFPNIKKGELFVIPEWEKAAVCPQGTLDKICNDFKIGRELPQWLKGLSEKLPKEMLKIAKKPIV